MRETATGAGLFLQEPEKEVSKVRVQSTPTEIDNFHRFLEKCQELGLCEVLNFSATFPNKGTRRYYRAYCDIAVNGEVADNE